MPNSEVVLESEQRVTVPVTEAGVQVVERSPLAECRAPVIAISLLAAMHFLIDTAAGTVNPLWQGFEDRLHVARGGLLWVVVAWQGATSFSQLLFAWWADRAPTRWLIWAGPLAGICCVGLSGVAPHPVVLAMLLITGGLGVAAFHPEAAAAVGAVAPLHRSRMMAIFSLWGFLGQSLGPYISARLTTVYGFPALLWGGACGLAALVLLMTQRQYIPAPALKRASAASAPAAESSWRTWALLLTVGTFRIVPSVGVPLVIAYWLTDRELIGTVQASFMVGVGAGSILCACLVRPQWERTVIWLQPLLAVPFLAAIPIVPNASLALTVGACGFILGVALPVFVSFGQQMLPGHPRAASSITMGVSWGTSGLIATAALARMSAWEVPAQTFFVFALFSAVAGVLSLQLPRVRPEA